MNKQTVPEIITNQIIDGLKQGRIPWQKPWTALQAQNFVSKHHYTGINPWLLALTCETRGYNHPLFASFNQITKVGGKVKKGEHGTLVVFTKSVKINVKPSSEENSEETTEKTIHMLRYYNVFNLQQTDLREDVYVKLHEIKQDANAQALFMAKHPYVKHGGDSAFYSPSEDYIQLPHEHTFINAQSYHETQFHELVHWTGHETRLNRDIKNYFGDADYSREELVAEIGANMLLAYCGLESVTNNSQAYINGWLSKLQNDSKFVILAASEAQKAYTYLISE